MEVTVPRNGDIEKFLEFMFYKRVGENEKTVTYEGAFPFALSFRDIGVQKRAIFYQQVKVKGGFKTRRAEQIDITPFRKKAIIFRISEEECNLLKKYIKAHETTISGHLRLRITEDLMGWMRLVQKTKKTQVLRKKHFEERRHEEEKMFR